MEKASCCCFTGHRILKVTDELKTSLRSVLVGLIESNALEFFAGGALGWDMLCEETVIELKKQYEVRLHLVLPCPVGELTTKWVYARKDRFDRILCSADSVTILSDNYYDGCMRERNAYLVEHCSQCVCCFNEKHSRSGTAQTVRMAKKNGLNIINLFYQQGY